MADRRIIALLALFMIALLPFAGSFLLHYPDERHYTDAGLWMLERGDFFTPLTSAGTPRLIKPITPYWVVAGGFEVIGYTPMACRLGFLLLGTAALWWTWRAGSEILGERGRGMTAALILASHLQFGLASTRSLPDVVLLFFMLLSAIGFLRILVLGRPTGWSYWLAYGGAGLACASKGLLPAVFVGYVWVFVIFLARPRLDWRLLVNIPAMTGGLALGVFWYGLMLVTHGQAFAHDFWLDQVQEKLAASWLAPGYRIPLMGFILFLNFLPWSVIALETWWKTGGYAGEDRRPDRTPWGKPAGARQEGKKQWEGKLGTELLPNFTRFVFGWVVLCCIIFGFGTNASLRYMLPVAPLGAIAMAELLHAQPGVAEKPLRGWAWIVLGVGVLLCGVLAFFNAQMEYYSLAAILVVIGIGLGVGGAWEMKRHPWGPATVIGVTMVLWFPILFFGLQRVFLPDCAKELAQAVLARQEAWGGQAWVFVGPAETAAKMRVHSGGRLKMGQLDFVPEQGLSEQAVYVLDSEYLLAVNPRQFAVDKIEAGYAHIEAGSMIKAVFSWEIKKYLDTHRQYFVVAVPRAKIAVAKPQ